MNEFKVTPTSLLPKSELPSLMPTLPVVIEHFEAPAAMAQDVPEPTDATIS
uniref:Uncharacterized protein n=2 Tax=Klebsiella TaxID=570 RepID=A0A1Z3ML90_KLEOX|nr:hypothetical protein [Klebsiella oxytoca]QTX14006.1 hypothetical protein [Klebsiella pneumoniae]